MGINWPVLRILLLSLKFESRRFLLRDQHLPWWCVRQPQPPCLWVMFIACSSLDLLFCWEPKCWVLAAFVVCTFKQTTWEIAIRIAITGYLGPVSIPRKFLVFKSNAGSVQVDTSYIPPQARTPRSGSMWEGRSLSSIWTPVMRLPSNYYPRLRVLRVCLPP